MELDELVSAWKDLDRRTRELDSEVVHLKNIQKLGRTASLVGRFRFAPIWDLCWGILAMGFIGNFLVEGPHNLLYVLSGLALDLAAWTTVASSVYQLVILARLDYSGPVLDIQKQLSSIRLLRIRIVQWTLLASPLLWAPLAIFICGAAFGFDILKSFGSAWVTTNFLFGVAIIPIVLWISKRFAKRFANSPFLTQLTNDIAGRSLTAALNELNVLNNFAEQ